jgi:hypothetical protein
MSVEGTRSDLFGNSTKTYRQSLENALGHDLIRTGMANVSEASKPAQSTYCWAASNIIRRMAKKHSRQTSQVKAEFRNRSASFLMWPWT